MGITNGDQELVELISNFWPNGTCGVVFLLKQDRGDDDICVHRPKGSFQSDGDLLPPALGSPQRILVAYYEAGAYLFTEL